MSKKMQYKIQKALRNRKYYEIVRKIIESPEFQKRKNFKSTFYHDLEMVDKILNKKNYHIVAIGFYNNNDSFLSISVVTDDIYKKLKNFEKQLES